MFKLITLVYVIAIWVILYIITRLVVGAVKNNQVSNPYGLINPKQPYG